VQPRFKDLRRPELVERKIQPQENFLRDVLDIFRTGDQTAIVPKIRFRYASTISLNAALSPFWAR